RSQLMEGIMRLRFFSRARRWTVLPGLALAVASGSALAQEGTKNSIEQAWFGRKTCPPPCVAPCPAPQLIQPPPAQPLTAPPTTAPTTPPGQEQPQQPPAAAPTTPEPAPSQQ